MYYLPISTCLADWWILPPVTSQIKLNPSWNILTMMSSIPHQQPIAWGHAWVSMGFWFKGGGRWIFAVLDFIEGVAGCWRSTWPPNAPENYLKTGSHKILLVLELSYFFKSYSKNLIKETGGLRLEMISRMVGHRKSCQNYAKLSLYSTGPGSQKKVAFIPSNVVDNIQEEKKRVTAYFFYLLNLITYWTW